MFGTLRLILAFLVVMSHAEIYLKVPSFYWFSQGTAALVGFFLLSGYLMKLIFIQKYQNKLNNCGKFWIDRWLRIFPHYYLYLIIIILWILLSHFSQLNWEMLPVLAHITVLPLNFVNLLQLQMLKGWAYWALIIPQAWTLASEFQFYLILPFLLRRRWLEIIALVISLGIFVMASFGILPTEAYGYRLLAGNLFIFITGSLIYDIRHSKNAKISKYVVSTAWLGLVVLAIILKISGNLQVPLNGPVIFGFLILVPIIWLLSGIKNRRNWDDFFSILSYGVFLNHYWLLWVLDWLNIYPQPNMIEKWIRFGIVIPISLLLSWISYSLIDKRITQFRRLKRN